ncbi:putative cytochrome P450 [Annulohypoxylon maeteangense]|uniref:putative cytochrome P450 n=1 Tax=Annulohypoxylon maeteangense TaxID=1927788 RepID=UPI002007B4C1|nr:putative cytochrome P450 [Annulohypoxylon maeteangense]KAI0886467.1 putative cytochrome P450 [Annulohypoxylon maeteangense]
MFLSVPFIPPQYVDKLVISSELNGLTPTPTAAGLVTALFGIFFLVNWPPSPFERVGKIWLLSFLSGWNAMTFTMEKHIAEGYTKVIKRSGKPFVMKWWAMDYVFLPPKYLHDLKRADTHELSFFENISKAFSLYASVDDLYSSELMIDIVKRGINTNLRQIIPLLDEESNHAFSMEVGTATDWKPFIAADLSGRIMHRSTSRILIGTELCRNESYLKTSQKLADSIFIHGLVMSMLPFRSIFRSSYDFLFTRFHLRNLRKAMEVILPVVQARFDEFQARESSSEKDHTKPLDAIEWSLEFSKGNAREHNPRWIALSLLHNIWAGSSAPGGLVTQMVFQVLTEPQYLEPLRAEAEAALRPHGYTDKALDNMPLMDSFIRELNRVYPTGAVTCARTVMNPGGFRFHDGLHLRQGTKIAVPALAIQTDPENFDDPLTVDAFRFARLREAASDNVGDEGEHNWGAATASETNLAFGYGKHACPGRFYAVRKAKLIFSKLILEYDLKWEGVKTRPPSLSVNGQFAPNQSQKIFLRKRTTT